MNTKILIIHTAFLGDVILITPLIKAVKLLFPNSELDVLVIPQTCEVLQHNPNVRDILIFDKRKNKILNFIRTAIQLRKKRYDLALLPHSSMTTSFLSFCSCIKRRIGFHRWLSSHLLTDKVLFAQRKLRIEKNLDLLNIFSKDSFSIQTELFPQDNDHQKAEELLSSLDENRRRIAIAPGSIWHTKQWPEHYFKMLAQKLVDAGFSIVMIGSPDEKDICDRILPSSHAINAAGKTTILESAALIKRCSLIICNDSGAMHIANAMQTDAFAIFGPTVKDFGYFPFRKNDHIFEVNLPCRPCGKHGGKSCPQEHHKCMELIDPESIYKKVCNFLNNDSD